MVESAEGQSSRAGQQEFFANWLEDAIEFAGDLLSGTGWRSIKRLKTGLAGSECWRMVLAI